MTGDAGFRDYPAETLERLQRRGIIVSSRFASTLEQFVIDGFNRSVHEGASRERFEAAWEQLIEVMISYAAETGTETFNANVFTRIRRRICPGFWPFC
jgi:hypothetical protein